MRRILMFLLTFVICSSLGCREKAHASKNHIMEIEVDSGISYADAYKGLLLRHDLIDEHAYPHVWKDGIIIDRKYFYPAVLPKDGQVSERGYFFDPYSKEYWYSDRPKIRYRIE